MINFINKSANDIGFRMQELIPQASNLGPLLAKIVKVAMPLFILLLIAVDVFNVLPAMGKVLTTFNKIFSYSKLKPKEFIPTNSNKISYSKLKPKEFILQYPYSCSLVKQQCARIESFFKNDFFNVHTHTVNFNSLIRFFLNDFGYEITRLNVDVEDGAELNLSPDLVRSVEHAFYCFYVYAAMDPENVDSLVANLKIKRAELTEQEIGSFRKIITIMDRVLIEKASESESGPISFEHKPSLLIRDFVEFKLTNPADKKQIDDFKSRLKK